MKEGKPLWGIVGLAIVIVAVIVAVVVAIRHDRPSQLPQGEAEITLETNGGVPYEWVYKIEDDSIVSHVGLKTKALDSTEGGVVEETHTFRALKEGETNIVFDYKDFVDEGEMSLKENIYRAKVDKNLNLTIELISSEPMN